MSLTAVPPLHAFRANRLDDDQPLTTGWVNAALSRLSALGLRKIADWLMEPGRGDRLERPPVEEMIRDVLDLTADELYGTREQRGRVRFELLALWANDPRYHDPDEVRDARDAGNPAAVPPSP